jgi:hypothetical protein
MQTRIQVVRGLLAGVGVMTLVLSMITIGGAVRQLQAWENDGLSHVSLVSLALGVVLIVLGGCLVVRGAKYEGRQA